MNLRDRKAIVTGATGGIGHAIARAIAARGAHVVVTGRRADVLAALAAELGAEALTLDLADPRAVHELAATHADADVVVANAALPASGLLSSFSEDEIDAALDVNLRAPIVLAQAFAAAMTQRGSGHLVFISSLSGKATSPGASMYNATKFGLRGFAGGLRAELHGTGVGVSAIFPGFIRGAGMFADAGITLPRGVGTRSPENVAAAVVKSIERNRGEIDVAPRGLRLGSAFAGIAPELSARVSRRLGGDDIASRLATGQAAKRR